MKLIGTIAFLVLISVGCQKEDIRPTHSCHSSDQTRAASDPTTDDIITVVDESGNSITDPNDANRTVRNPKPKAN